MIGPQPKVPNTLGQDIRELCQRVLSYEESPYLSNFERGIITGKQDLADDIRSIFKSHGLWVDKV